VCDSPDSHAEDSGDLLANSWISMSTWRDCVRCHRQQLGVACIREPHEGHGGVTQRLGGLMLGSEDFQ